MYDNYASYVFSNDQILNTITIMRKKHSLTQIHNSILQYNTSDM